MKKTIIKTVLITILSIFAVFLVSITAVTMLSPIKLSNFFYNMGNESLSVWYIELQYQKTSRTSDLELLIYRANEAEDYKRVIKYSDIMINMDNYSEICAENDANNSDIAYNIKYNDYILGNYTISLYKSGSEKEKIFEIADKSLNGKYLPDNAYQCLIYSATNDIEMLTAIKDKLSLHKDEFNDSQEFINDYEYLTNKVDVQKGE